MESQLINPRAAEQSWLDEWTDRYLAARCRPRTADVIAAQRAFTDVVRRMQPFASRGYMWATTPTGDLVMNRDPRSARLRAPAPKRQRAGMRVLKVGRK